MNEFHLMDEYCVAYETIGYISYISLSTVLFQFIIFAHFITIFPTNVSILSGRGDCI
jgi:hypothetical protein